MPDDTPLHDIGIGAERVLAEQVKTQRLLGLVLRELVEIRGLLQQRDRAPASRLHARTAGPLLAEIAAAVGSLVWSARELIEERDTKLQGALAAAIGPLDAGASRRLGQLLSRVEGMRLGGNWVERVDDDKHGGATWRVLRV